MTAKEDWLHLNFYGEDPNLSEEYSCCEEVPPIPFCELANLTWEDVQDER